VELYSHGFSHITFDVIPASEAIEAGLRSGRSAYRSVDEIDDLYLYHVVSDPQEDGVGRWVINDVLGANDVASAYADSWAVTPTLIDAINDHRKGYWQIYNGDDWVFDNSFVLKCSIPETGNMITQRSDHTVFLDVRGFAWSMSGFYVSTAGDTGETSGLYVYSHVRSDADVQVYLYKVNDTWVIGENIGSREALGYVKDDALTADSIQSKQWSFVDGYEWRTAETTVLSGNAHRNIYEVMREHRAIKNIPSGQRMFRLRNGVPMPYIGLGTGGIHSRDLESVAGHALRMGYRMFDLAREYKNEAIMSRVLNSDELQSVAGGRSEVFLVSKVWPTNLGYRATGDEILSSLGELDTAYVDLYLLHWPECIPAISWMHCETTLDPEGTWQQSWRAMERAYGEGRVMAIGVSNFNIELLREASVIGTVRPHAVQNFAEPGSLDLEVRQWCDDYGAAYMPYASQRNFHLLSTEMRTTIERVAKGRGVSPYAVISNFFLQSGATIIPRSSNPSHLQELMGITKWYLTLKEMQDLGWPYGSISTEL